MTDQLDWKEWKEDAKAERELNRTANTQDIYDLAESLSFDVRELTEYHFRLTRSGKTLDVFPTSGKIMVFVGHVSYQRPKNLLKFIENYFVSFG